MLARRPYEDLTGIERDNRAKKKIIDYEKKKRFQQKAKQEDEEFVENADLESKKSRYIDISDQYLVTLQQTLDYFGNLPGAGAGAGNVLRFVNANRVGKFYDNFAKLEYYNQQLRDVIQSILKVIPVNDPFLKKLKKKNEQLNNMLLLYSTLFQPQIQANIPVTNFNRANMILNKEEIDDRLFSIVNNLRQLINDNNNTILFLESTPRSGQGRKKYNIDTTEYIIPSKYL